MGTKTHVLCHVSLRILVISASQAIYIMHTLRTYCTLYLTDFFPLKRRQISYNNSASASLPTVFQTHRLLSQSFDEYVLSALSHYEQRQCLLAHFSSGTLGLFGFKAEAEERGFNGENSDSIL